MFRSSSSRTALLPAQLRSTQFRNLCTQFQALPANPQIKAAAGSFSLQLLQRIREAYSTLQTTGAELVKLDSNSVSAAKVEELQRIIDTITLLHELFTDYNGGYSLALSEIKARKTRLKQLGTLRSKLPGAEIIPENCAVPAAVTGGTVGVAIPASACYLTCVVCCRCPVFDLFHILGQVVGFGCGSVCSYLGATEGYAAGQMEENSCAEKVAGVLDMANSIEKEAQQKVNPDATSSCFSSLCRR